MRSFVVAMALVGFLMVWALFTIPSAPFLVAIVAVTIWFSFIAAMPMLIFFGILFLIYIALKQKRE